MFPTIPNLAKTDVVGLQNLISAAMVASACRIGVLYRQSADQLVALMSLGDKLKANDCAVPAFVSNSWASPGTPLVVTNEAEIDGWPHQSGGDADGSVTPLQFVAAIPLLIGEEFARAVLILGTSTQTLRLSAAQIIALESITAQISTKLHAAFLPPVSATSRFQPNERLRLLESVVVNARDSILITEAEPISLPGPKIVYCNPAFTITTGYSEADVLGKTPRILHGPRTDRAALEILKSALRAWKPVEIELLNYRKDGSEFWVELSIVPVADERGWFTHWVSVQRDTTARRLAEAVALQAVAAEQEREALKIALAEKSNAQAKLVYAATHDALTGLYNRTYMIDRISATLQRAKHDATVQSTVMFLDLDGFKAINDTLGHAAGDALLLELSARLVMCVGEANTLARMSGDEFVALFDGPMTDTGSENMALHINAECRRPLPEAFRKVYISCSIGIVRISKDHTNAEEILRDADVAMYAAKRTGSGRYMFFKQSMRDVAMDAVSLQTDLRAAAFNNAFFVHYQPIYNIHTRKITSVEALIRWTHENRGSVSPADFIPVAEQIGIVASIDQWVRNTSFEQIINWQEKMPSLKLTLNINVSASELRDSLFLANLERLAIACRFQLSDLQIEITEGVLLDDSPTTLRIIQNIRSKGIRVALDDFGTGYSSLAYIDRYQIDTLKIDRSFVSKLTTSARTAAILQSIVFLAKQLNLDIVAEGVETEQQLQALAAMGCGFVQGYLLSKPVDAEKIEQMLSMQNFLAESV